MPTIRVTKKKIEHRDEETGGIFNVKTTIMKGSQQPKQLYYNSVMNGGELKLYWQRIPSIKWAPDSREGSTMVTAGNKIILFGGLSSRLHKDT